jgi:hypothetical protein
MCACAVGLALAAAYLAGDQAQGAVAPAKPATVAAPVAVVAPPRPAQPVASVQTPLGAGLKLVSDTRPARPFQLPGGAQTASRDVDCLTAAVYYEARGETAAGQAAVAQVVLNRVRHPAFPKTVCGVVYQGVHTENGCQFSFACNGALGRPRELGAWRRAQGVATHALDGGVMAVVGDATHFHALSAGSNFGRGMTRVAQVGLQVFYRFSGYAGSPARFTAEPQRSTDDAQPASAQGRRSGQYLMASASVQPAAPTPSPVPAKVAVPLTAKDPVQPTEAAAAGA